MADDRSSGFFGGSGFVRFNSSDSSGNIAGIPDKKRSRNQSPEPDEEDEEKKDEFKESEFIDRSAQLRATLNSLAMLNVAGIIRNKPSKSLEKPKKEELEKENQPK